MKDQYCIGVTGGIGSGKSTVSRLLSKRSGLPLVDVDQLCKELLEIEEPGWLALKESLGGAFFLPDGQLNRGCLRTAIFDDSGLRQQVDKLIHPLALDMLDMKMADLEGPVLVDVPLLFEAGWKNRFQSVVVVYADPQTCCRRLLDRDKILPTEAAKAICSQMEICQKVMLADHVVDNRYCRLVTLMQVSRLAGLFQGNNLKRPLAADPD